MKRKRFWPLELYPKWILTISRRKFASLQLCVSLTAPAGPSQTVVFDDFAG
jgi:hypothetical protein